MRYLQVVIAAVGLLAFAAPATMAQAPAAEKPWFDMVNCGFCKNLVVDPMLLPNTAWEHYDLDNGLLSVAVVKPEYQASFKKAMHAMEGVGQEMMQGKMVPMCGYCEAYGKLMVAGAKEKSFSGDWGMVTLLTSDKPEVVEMIHKYGQRTRTEMAMMEEAAKPEKQ